MNTIWMILLSTLAASACNGSSVNPDPGTNELAHASVSSAKATNGLVNIRFDETITYLDLELRWLEVVDSRCPSGVQCVWAGEVKVTLEATHSLGKGNKPTEIQLTLQARGKPAAVSVFAYELELLNVDPYPKKEVAPERSNYVAEIRISDAGRE